MALALAVAILCVVVYLAFDMHWRARAEVVSRYRHGQTVVARYVARDLRSYVRGREQGLEALSTFPSIQHHEREQAARDLDGFFKVLKNRGVSALSAYDENGTVFASTSPETVGENSASEAFFGWARKPENPGKFLVTPPLGPPDPRTKLDAMKVLLVTPVQRDEDGRFAGVVALSVDLGAVLMTQLSAFSSDDVEKHQFWVLDSDGTLLFHSGHPEMVGRSARRDNEQCRGCHGSFAHVETMLAQGQGALDYSVEGVGTRMASFESIDLENRRWIVVASAGNDTASGFVTYDLYETLLLLGVSVLTLAMCAVFVFRTERSRLRAEEKTRRWREKRAHEEKLRQSEARSLEALKESEIRYRTLFETLPDAVVLAEPETGLNVEFNDAACRRLGYTREEFARLRISDYQTGETPEQTRARTERILAGGQEEFETRQRTRQGDLRDVYVTVQAMDLSGRKLLHTVSTDITKQKRLEEQYRQAQKMEAVGRLSGGVAHDFNNLLTVILGYDDILLQGLEQGPLRDAAEEIQRSGQRAAGLTRQLLAFSRKQTFVPEVLHLGELVSGTSVMVERLIGEEISVRVIVSPDLGLVKGDRSQMEQVIMNLAINARDAMPKGGSLTLELRNVELDDHSTAASPELEPGPYVLLAISDTGTGMDTETMKSIFEPFFTTKEPGKGTGLGLSTVYGIVHQSDGAIDVDSEPGRGTTFRIYLPRVAGFAANRSPLSGIHRAAIAGSETVLVVEDEAAIRQLASLVLRRAGYEVLVAVDPAEAERIVVSHPGPIHLLLTDVVMPGMRGPDLAERACKNRPDIRVLYMSGYSQDAISHRGVLDAGMELLQKPFTPARLTEKVREVLDRSGP
jgi:two-component system cell cycle sensor histidine kinase/response regulator CckA